jgi:UDP-2-acetamido-2,6-beta-L-arabino-hexul-4-ose reductase
VTNKEHVALKKIAITGAAGFIGRNLVIRLRETCRFDAVPLTRMSSAQQISDALSSSDFVIHLAGVNRPQNVSEFDDGNVGSTESLCQALASLDRPVPVLYASSIMATQNNDYGRSKAAAEKLLLAYGDKTKSPVRIFRLPNIFGKWCRPNYNSAVATFCYNVSHDLPIAVNVADAALVLAYIYDVVDAFIREIDRVGTGNEYRDVAPVYAITVGELASIIRGFSQKREQCLVDAVGVGLVRALYATYISYLEPEKFAYPLIKHEDKRGWFSEFVKTEGAGQVSVFTAHPGITRGGHYHHSKTEKFLIVQGQALFRFRHIESQKTHEIRTSGDSLMVVETVPGWAHDVTNVGETQLVCFLWANELFNASRPDTVTHQV